jgi:peptidoglycan hydrolase-like protein with peptidoglycan-binding domain
MPQSFSLIWLPHVLKSAGLKVAEVPGWESRGRGDMKQIFGVICHHTVGAKTGNMPSLKLIRDGRSDLAGPLAQLGLGRDGTFYVIAAGKCNHAGKGIWKGLMNGNSNFIGIEAENTGGPDNFPWPDVQVDAYQRGVAAILKHIGQPADFCAGHKEYALPRGRKIDPNFDMVTFRQKVAAIMNGTIPPLQLIPAEEPASPGNTARPTLRRGMNDPAVQEVQRKLGLQVNGNFDEATEAAVRALQRKVNLVPDGIVGPKTWKALDKI